MQPIVRPQPTFRDTNADGGAGGMGYYRRQGSPTPSPQHSGPLPPPTAPIILNADNVSYQVQSIMPER